MENSIPEINLYNVFLQDPLADKFWPQFIGADEYTALRHYFVQFGKNAALATPLSDQADKMSPKLISHTPQGTLKEHIQYHPAYEELKKLAYGAGIVALKYDAEFLAKFKQIRHRVGFGLGFYFAHTELGLYCPICMTDGVGWVLEKYGKGQVHQEALKHIAAKDLHELWQGAMFLTEKQGGSDVGTNTVSATQKGHQWFLDGEKWFCSNVDADAILALARMPGMDLSTGTRGLGLFLVLRKIPQNNSDTIRIHRLKDKLGVRSMPTGEVTFERTEAYLIGGADLGFKQMTDMLNMSRMYNSVTSVSVMKRCIMEALAYGAKRRAFGQELWHLPLWRSVLADVIAESLGAQFLLFSAISHFDRADCGDEHSLKIVRLLTPITKAMTGKLVMGVVSECMEAVGGNAYIEESIFPRLLRDAQVLSIWEGTTNILSLDALRVLKKYGVDFYYDHLENELAQGSSIKSSVSIETLRQNLKDEKNQLLEVLKMPLDMAARNMRRWIESAGRSYTLVQLYKSTSNQGMSEISNAVMIRLAARHSYTAIFGTSKDASLENTEEVLLAACFSK